MHQPRPNPPPADSLWRLEAARYALLRRLAYAMRHHMVVNLQPIGMITDLLDRRLNSPEPQLDQVRQSMERINGLSRAAVQSCLDVVSWLAPEDEVTIGLRDGVAECLALVRSNLSFRGFDVREEISGNASQVRRTALRSVLPAALLTLTDAAVAPAMLVLAATAGASGATVTLRLEPGDGSPGFAGDAPYRVLGWDEVQLLAAAEGAVVERAGGHQVVLRFT